MKETRPRFGKKFYCEKVPWEVAILTKMLYMAKFKILNLVNSSSVFMKKIQNNKFCKNGKFGEYGWNT